jgi:thiol-disulfide isomerase/thioredoxin
MNTNKVKKVKEFSASWCAPCRAFAPTFKKISEMDEFSEITFEAIHLDDDEDHDVDIAKFDVKSIPTTILLDENDEPIYKLMGNVPEKDLVDLITQCLKDR